MKREVYLTLCFVCVSVFGITPSFSANSGQIINGFTVGKVIPGYNCLLVKLPPEAEEKRSFKMFPKVFAAPTEASRQVGIAMGTVYVTSPINTVDGFIEILRPNGDRGWIEAKDTKPFTYPIYSDIPGRCTISMSARGGIGFQGYSLTQSK